MRIFGLFLLLIINTCLYAKAIYVDKQNVGTADGTVDNPYVTITEAINNADPNDTIYISGGIYRESVNITLDNLTIIGADSDVYITGTDTINDWNKVAEGIYKAYMPHKCTRVFANTIPQFKARYPNTPAGTNLFEFNTIQISLTDTVATITAPHIVDEKWADGTIWMLVGHRWIAQTARIESYDAGKLHLQYLSAENNGDGIAYITNTLQALDTVGEWHWQNDTLYYFFGSVADINTFNIEAQVRETVIDISNRNSITISGINTYSGNILMDGTNNSTIKQCEVKYLNNYHYIEKENTAWYSSWSRHKWTNINSHGVGIGVFGNNNLIDQCEISWSSGDCITLYGEDNTVSNCIISNANYLGCDMAPVSLGGKRNKIVHNEIFNGGRGVVTFLSAKEFEISYNKVYSAGLLNWDIGCLYTYGTDSEGGIISYNWIYDANPSNPQSTWGGHGIYLDNNSSNYIVHHNVVWDCKGDGIRLNLPANNLNVYNNTAFECEDMVAYLNPIFAGQSSSNCTFKNNYINGSILTESWLEVSNNLSSETDYVTNREQYDFMPFNSSPLIDGGVIIDTQHEFIGAAPDIGAYENGGIEWGTGPYSTEDISMTVDVKTSKEQEIMCFPNPTTSNIVISNGDFQQFSILSATGKEIKSGSIKNRIIPMDDIPNGIYIVRIFNALKSQNMHVIKK